MKNPPSFCVVKIGADFWHTQKRYCFFEKAGAKIKSQKNALKIAAHARSAVFLQTNEKCKNGYDFARRLICAEKMHGTKNGYNLLSGQKAAKAGWIVFDSGRRGGGPIQAIGKKITWRWRANPGHLQKKRQRALATGR